MSTQRALKLENEVRNLNLNSHAKKFKSVESKEELIALRKKNNGYLSPQIIVDFAKDPKTAMHAYFEWDDSIGAQKWRLQQARAFVHLKFKLVSIPNPVKPQEFIIINDMTSLRIDRGTDKAYTKTTSIIEDVDKRKILLMEAKSEFMALRKKYQHLVELVDVWPLVDSIFK